MISVTVIWSMIMSTCLTIAGMHFLVWYKLRTEKDNLLFSLAAIATAALAGCELWMMTAETPVQFAAALRWLHVPAYAIFLSLIGFVLVNLRTGRRWLAWVVCFTRTISLLLNFLVGQNLNYLEVTHLQPIRFLGSYVSVAEGKSNPWMLVGQLGLVLFIVFVADATITAWRTGYRRKALMVGGSIMFFLLIGSLQSILVLWQIIAIPLTPSFFFLGIVTVMGWDMASERIRSAKLSEDLCKKQDWLDMAADSAGVGLWLWDIKTDVIWATARTRKLYAFSSDELIHSEKFLSKLHPDDSGWVARALECLKEEGLDFRHDYRIVLPDGSIRWIRVLAKMFLMQNGQPERMTGVSVDITERKQMKLEIEQKRIQLAHVTRVSTMGQLASTLAHELNQPLGAILRNAEAAELFLQDPSPDLDEVRAILADIRKDDQRAGKVIEKVRAMMRQSDVERCQLDLRLLTREAISMIQSDADRRHTNLAVYIDMAMPQIYGDQVQLEQVLINLLMNSLDALDEISLKKRVVTLSTKHIGAMVEVSVCDNGPGISAEKLPHIFEPFFSDKPNGLGMGLAISRGIIEAHGGRLWAKNNELEGATFTFALPVEVGVNAT